MRLAAVFPCKRVDCCFVFFKLLCSLYENCAIGLSITGVNQSVDLLFPDSAMFTRGVEVILFRWNAGRKCGLLCEQRSPYSIRQHCAPYDEECETR